MLHPRWQCKPVWLRVVLFVPVSVVVMVAAAVEGAACAVFESYGVLDDYLQELLRTPRSPR
jgi:uncharacterized membrane protein